MVNRAALEATYQEKSSEELRVIATSAEYSALARELAVELLLARGEPAPPPGPLVASERKPLFPAWLLSALVFAVIVATAKTLLFPREKTAVEVQSEEIQQRLTTQSHDHREAQQLIDAMKRCREARPGADAGVDCAVFGM